MEQINFDGMSMSQYGLAHDWMFDLAEHEIEDHTPKKSVGKPNKHVEESINDGFYHYKVTITSAVESPTALLESLNKVLNSASFEIRWYEGWLELTKSGLPHIHICCHSKKYMKAQAVLRLCKTRVDVSRCKTTLEHVNWHAYIRKDEDTRLPAYLIKHSVCQVYTSDEHGYDSRLQAEAAEERQEENCL